MADTTMITVDGTFAAAIRSRNVSPKTLTKAARIVADGRIHPTDDPGVYRVDGDHGSYWVGVVSDHRGVCTCPAGTHGKWCAHLVAAIVTHTATTSAAPETQGGRLAGHDGAGPDGDDHTSCRDCGVDPEWDGGLCWDCWHRAADEEAGERGYAAMVDDQLGAW